MADAGQILRDFEAEYGLIGSGFQDGAIAFFAVKNGDKWLLARAHFRIVMNTMTGVNYFRTATEQFVAGVEPIKKADIPNTIFRALREGVLAAGDLTLHLHGKPETFILDYRGFRSPLNQSWPRTFVLTLIDNTPFDWVALCGGKPNMDAVLRSLPAPYDGLDELAGVLGLGLMTAAESQSRLVVTGDVPVVLDKGESRLTDDALHIDVHAANGIDRAKVRIGYRILPDPPSIRASITGEALTWTDGNAPRGRADIPMKDKSAALVLVSYCDQVFDRWWLSNINRLMNFHVAAYDPFDAGRTFLKEAISATADNKSDDLELGIAVLLSLCGFTVAPIGQMSRLREGPDLVAISTQGEIVVVEVTTTPILDTKDKLSKVIARSRQLKESLEKSGWGHLPVQPLIVTSASRSLITDTEKARTNNVAVAALEDTTRLLEQLIVPINASDVFAAIGRLVPPAPAIATLGAATPTQGQPAPR